MTQSPAAPAAPATRAPGTAEAPNRTDRDFDSLALLAGLKGATTDDLRLLKIITDPENSQNQHRGETHLEVADEFKEDFGAYLGDGHIWNVGEIGAILADYYDGRPDRTNDGSLNAAEMPSFAYGFTCDSDGTIDGIDVQAAILPRLLDGTADWANRVVLTRFVELKHTTTDREATGLASALAIAQALEQEFLRLANIARNHGLLAVNHDIIQAGRDALAAYDATPKDEDIDVDTLASMREALAALLIAQGADLAPNAGAQK